MLQKHRSVGPFFRVKLLANSVARDCLFLNKLGITVRTLANDEKEIIGLYV